MSSAQDGHGTTITFGSSGFSAALIGVGGPAATRGAIKSSTMSTADAPEYIPEELYDGGEVKIVVEHDGSDTIPIASAAETITINWGGTGNSDSFSGFCTAYEASASIGERMQGTMTIKVTGAIS